MVLVLILILAGAGSYLLFGNGLKGAMGDSPDELVQMAVADLAQRLGIGEGEIQVVSAEEITWPDASLGCPEPGMMYAQVLTPGYKIILKAKGEQYEYHADKTRVKLCPKKETSEAASSLHLRLAYLKEPEKPDPNGNMELWMKETSSGNERLIAQGVTEFHFSPPVARPRRHVVSRHVITSKQKRAVALVRRNSRSSLELSFAKANGEERKPYMTCVAISGFQWAPDGKHFAFLCRKELAHYDLGVVIGSVDEPAPKELVYLPEGEKMVRGELTWGQGELAWGCGPGCSVVILKAFDAGGKCNVWAIPLDTMEPQLLLKDCGQVEVL